MMEVYIVSFVTSSVSALAILLSGSWQSGHDSVSGAEAFASVIPVSGGLVVMLSACSSATPP